MTKVDILRIYAEQNLQQANEAADARRLSKARLNLKRNMDALEMGDEEEEEL